MARRSRKVHWLKTWPEQFDAVARGDKHHEVRRTDRELPYEVGDHLILRRWCPERRAYTVPRQEQRVEVTHVTPGGQFGLPDDLCVMSVAHLHPSGTLCCAAHARGHERSRAPW